MCLFLYSHCKLLCVFYLPCFGFCAFQQPQQQQTIAAHSSATPNCARTTPMTTTTSTTRIRIRVGYSASPSSSHVTTGPVATTPKQLLPKPNGWQQLQIGSGALSAAGFQTTFTESVPTMISSTMTTTSIRCRTPSGVSDDARLIFLIALISCFFIIRN